MFALQTRDLRSDLCAEAQGGQSKQEVHRHCMQMYEPIWWTRNDHVLCTDWHFEGYSATEDAHAAFCAKLKGVLPSATRKVSFNIGVTSGKICKKFVKGAHYDSKHQSFEPTDPEATVSEHLASNVDPCVQHEVTFNENTGYAGKVKHCFPCCCSKHEKKKQTQHHKSICIYQHAA